MVFEESAMTCDYKKGAGAQCALPHHDAGNTLRMVVLPRGQCEHTAVFVATHTQRERDRGTQRERERVPYSIHIHLFSGPE